MSTTPNAPQDFPAVEGNVVTERHARICRESGHVAYVVDGVDQGSCARCGEVADALSDQTPNTTAVYVNGLRIEIFDGNDYAQEKETIARVEATGARMWERLVFGNARVALRFRKSVAHEPFPHLSGTVSGCAGCHDYLNRAAGI